MFFGCGLHVPNFNVLGLTCELTVSPRKTHTRHPSNARHDRERITTFTTCRSLTQSHPSLPRTLDTSDDVSMEGESLDENSAGHSNQSGSDSRRRITTKREPREARDEQSIATEQHVPIRILRKTTPQDHAVAVTTQEASDGSREKTMSVANIENNSLNWVSGALDMTNCDFRERRARDTSLEATSRTSSLGPTRTEIGNVRRRTRTIPNFCVHCTKHKRRRDGTLCTN